MEIDPTEPPDNDQKDSDAAWWRVGISLFVLHLLARVWLAWTFPLYYPETLIWQQSLQPAMGYAENPPFVAWGMAMCAWAYPGDPILAGRVLAVLVGSTWPWLIAAMAYLVSRNRRCSILALIMVLGLPGLTVVATFWLADTPFVLFQILALYFCWLALEREWLGHWILAGMFLGLAILCKFTGVLMLLALTAYLVASARHRRWLSRPGPWVGLLTALAICAPFLWWNLGESWPSLDAVSSAMNGAGQGLKWRKLPEVFLEQVVNCSLLLIALFFALVVPLSLLPANQREGFRFLRFQAIAFIGFAFLAGLLFETHPDWTIPAYPLAAICAAMAWRAAPRRYGLPALPACAVGAVGLLLPAAFLQSSVLDWMLQQPSHPKQSQFQAKMDRVQRTFLGFDALHRRLAELEESGIAGQRPTVFGMEREHGGVIGYMRRRPVVDLGQLLRDRQRPDRNEPDCPQPSSVGGLLFVERGDALCPVLQAHFEQVTRLPPLEIRQGDRIVKDYALFVLGNLKPLPEQVTQSAATLALQTIEPFASRPSP